MKSVTFFISFITFWINFSLAQFQNNACKNVDDYSNLDLNLNCYFNPDVSATTPEIIRNHGFRVESHFVITADGYILQLFRIPPEPDDFRKNKQPIVFNHGSFSDSSAFVFAGKKTLALSLARDGYDIWLLNHRGTVYSRRHRFLDTSSRAYWNWTFDTVVNNDIPLNLEKVSDVTGKSGSIIYVGHSRGSNLGLMYIINNPNSKILQGLIVLGPVAYHGSDSRVKLAYSTLASRKEVLANHGIYAIFQNSKFIMNLFQNVCPFFSSFCKYLIDSFSGKSDQFLPDDLLNFFNHFPSAESIQETTHNSQLIHSERLQKFDYGKKKNLAVYGQETPPIYDLSKVGLPIFLFYAQNDQFASVRNTFKQFNDFGSSVKNIYKIPIGIEDERLQWSHNDFLYGKDIHRHLYKPLRKVLEEELVPNNTMPSTVFYV